MAWRLIFPAVTLCVSSGCMMAGMRMGGSLPEATFSESPQRVRTVNRSRATDAMVEEAVSDLLKKDIGIRSIAVWQIRSQTAGIDAEIVRQKIIARLVNQNRFDVVSRQRLGELLEEHSFALSGHIDEKSAVEIGNLIGVQGFIDGYMRIENDGILMSLKLVEAKTGIIMWAKTVEASLASVN